MGTQTDQLKKMLEQMQTGKFNMVDCIRDEVRVHQALALSRIADAKEQEFTIEEVIGHNCEVDCEAFHETLVQLGYEGKCHFCEKEFVKAHPATCGCRHCW